MIFCYVLFVLILKLVRFLKFVRFLDLCQIFHYHAQLVTSLNNSFPVLFLSYAVGSYISL